MRHRLGLTLALVLAGAAWLQAADAVQTQPPSAVVNSCSQITVSAPFLGDDNGSSTTTKLRATPWPGA